MIEIARDYIGIITAVGAQIIADAMANGTQITLDTVAVGDGGGAVVRPNESVTKLVREQWRGAVSGVTIDPNDRNKVWIQVIIPPDHGGFTIRELGVYCGNRLFGYASYPASYKPLPDEGAFGDFEIQMEFIVSSTEHIDVTIDPYVIVATKQDIIDHDNNIEAHQGHFVDSGIHFVPAACTYDSAAKAYNLVPGRAIKAGAAFYTVRFKTPNDYVAGAVFKIGGKSFTPKLSNSNEAVPSKVFLSGRVIDVNFDAAGGIVTIPSGGGVGGVFVYSNTAPTSAEDKKKLWICSDSTNTSLYRSISFWDGSAWVSVETIWAEGGTS